MKQKILVRRINKEIVFPIPTVCKKGDWVDLRSAKTINLKAPQADVLKRRVVDGQEEKYRNVYFDLQIVPLGVAMQLPKGFEAILALRSSSPKNYGILLANGIGVIDGTTTKDSIGYNGNDDEWKAPLLSFRDTTIEVGDRICQFRIQLSQKATVWQKIKWVLSSGIEFVEVDELPNKNNRDGFGSSGKH